MAVLNTAALPPAERDEINRRAIAALKSAGATLPDDFQCEGIPQISLSDATQKDGVPFDIAPFRGRLVFGGNMNCSDVAPFPCGPVRITVIRWGKKEDQCGRVTVGKTDLVGTSVVSYVGVTIGDHVHLGPRVVIMDCDGHPADRSLPDVLENKKMAPIVIEDYAWIGYGALIMKGVTIGHHAVVAPGAVVAWSVPAHGVVLGAPAKSVKVFQRHMISGGECGAMADFSPAARPSQELHEIGQRGIALLMRFGVEMPVPGFWCAGMPVIEYHEGRRRAG